MENTGVLQNAFTQILISEIENLNFRCSQYSLILTKGNTEQFPNNKVPEDIVKFTQNLIDDIKISINQIIRRFKAVAKKIRLDKKEIELLEAAAKKIKETKIPDEQELEALLAKINEIYAESLIEAQLETTGKTVREFTGK